MATKISKRLLSTAIVSLLAMVALLVPLASSAEAQSSSFGDGVFNVGTDIAPGVYFSTSLSAGRCIWQRLDAADDTIAQNFFNDGVQAIVAIAASDTSFISSSCGTWVPLPGVSLQQVSVVGTGTWSVQAQLNPGVYQAPMSENCCQ